jgi:hypothetical protein
VRFFNNIFSLFPKGNDPKLAKDLLNNPDAMTDQPSQLANAIEHKICHSKLVEKGLLIIKQKTRVDLKPLPMKHVFVCSCLCLQLGQKGSAQYSGVSHSLDHDSGAAEGKVWGETE